MDWASRTGDWNSWGTEKTGELGKLGGLGWGWEMKGLGRGTNLTVVHIVECLCLTTVSYS